MPTDPSIFNKSGMPITPEDLKFIRSILPASYRITPHLNLKNYEIHCVSEDGIHDENGETNEGAWGSIFESIKSYFKERFMEVYHNTNFCHKDFLIYIKL